MKKITRKNLRPFLERHASSVRVLDIGGGRIGSNHSYDDLFPNRHTFDIDSARQPDTIGDAHKMPFADSEFDVILCTEVLEHLHSPWIAIDEMKRVLKPGGKLILTTRFVFPIHDAPHDYYRYTEFGLRHLFKGWDIVELIPETQTLSAIGALLQRVGFQTTVRGGKLTKVIIYGLAWMFDKLNPLITAEFGDIKKKHVVSPVITTGYYLVAKL